MGKYQSFQKDKKEAQPVQPIWTGIGFLLIVIVPIMAWYSGVLTLEYGLKAGWPIPADLLGAPGTTLSPMAREVQVLVMISNWLGQQQDLNAKILFALVYLLLFSGLISTLYAFVYRAFGPKQYSPLDAPPEPARRNRRIR